MTSQDYRELNGGFTQNFVRKVGNLVVKSGTLIGSEAAWYDAFKDKQYIPEITTVDPGAITMEWIDADGTFSLDETLLLIEKYRAYPILNDLKFDAYRRRIQYHLTSNPIHGAAKLLIALENLDLPATFCHGDLSIRNILPTKNGIKLIDPLYYGNFGSYWLDYAKLAFTLKFFNGDVSTFNELLSRTGTSPVLIASECVRVATYNPRFNFISENLINELT